MIEFEEQRMHRRSTPQSCYLLKGRSQIPFQNSGLWCCTNELKKPGKIGNAIKLWQGRKAPCMVLSLTFVFYRSCLAKILVRPKKWLSNKKLYVIRKLRTLPSTAVKQNPKKPLMDITSSVSENFSKISKKKLEENIHNFAPLNIWDS